jgi:hypothetical protein
MASVEAQGIFPTGAYYPQLHPQAVENTSGRLGRFDRTTSHASKKKIDLT